MEAPEYSDKKRSAGALAGLLLVVCAVVFLGACAKAPVVALEDARQQVNHAAAIGAQTWSPGEYALARSALTAAEQQYAERHYRSASRTLELAQRYADEATRITERAKRVQAEAERRRLEEERLAAQQRQQQLEEERSARLRAEEEQRRKVAAARAAAAARVTQEPKPAPVQQPAAADPQPVESYEVQAGQTLASIAERPEVYGDSLLWPLIYRANRDQIKAPQEISAGQVLAIPRDKNRDELEAARQEARELDLF
ncbi:MAG: DUF4398 domain-containing protein [Pelovirga sp.]